VELEAVWHAGACDQGQDSGNSLQPQPRHASFLGEVLNGSTAFFCVCVDWLSNTCFYS
jgi:hypothetical protein